MIMSKVTKMNVGMRAFGVAALFSIVCALPVSLNAAVGSLSLSYAQNAMLATDASNTLDATSELWLVWDSADRGTNLSDWPVANRVQYTGMVPSADATYEFDRTRVPAGSVFRVIATSKARRLGEGGYVYAGISQYINTGVNADGIYGFYIKFQYSANDWNQGSGGNAWSSLIGDDPTYDFTIGRKANGTDGQFYMRYRGVSVKSGTTADLAFALNDKTVPHEIAVANQMATLDGATAVASLEEGAIGTKALPVLIGCSWAEKSTTPASLSQRYCHARWYSVRFDDASGNAILNLVPVVRNGEGLLYDTVSGACHANANAATGDLTWGGSELGEVIDGTEGTAAASSAVANEMSVTIVRSGGIDVYAPAGVLSSVSELWLVWDSADRGADLANWPAANRVKFPGTVSSAAATYRFSTGILPFKCVFRVIEKMPIRLLGEGGYVYAGRNQYFDTGIKATAIYGFYIKFMYSANDWSGRNAYALLIADEGNKDFAVGRYVAGSPDGRFYIKHRNTTGTPNGYFDISGSGLGQIHEFAIANQTATLDGVTVLSGLEVGAIGQKNLRVWLSNGYPDDTVTELEGTIPERCCHARWYSVRFDDADGNAILNLAPAVRGDSEGVLYDSVSGRALRNAGTGVMTYGGTPGEVVDFDSAAASVPVLLKRNGCILIVK